MIVAFILICLAIAFISLPLLVAGTLVANKKRLEKIKDILAEIERGLCSGHELKALDEAYYLRDQIETTKDIHRLSIANVYIRKIEGIVKERT